MEKPRNIFRAQLLPMYIVLTHIKVVNQRKTKRIDLSHDWQVHRMLLDNGYKIMIYALTHTYRCTCMHTKLLHSSTVSGHQISMKVQDYNWKNWPSVMCSEIESRTTWLQNYQPHTAIHELFLRHRKFK